MSYRRRNSTCICFLGPLATPTCPYCRQRMTVLLPFFSDLERNAADLDAVNIEERQRIYENIRSYNRCFSGNHLSFHRCKV